MVWGFETILLFLCLAVIAEILGTVGAFGSSVFFVPLAALFMEFHTALGLTAIFHVSSNLTKIVLFRKGIDKRLLVYLGIPAVLAVIVFSYLTKFVESDNLELALGLSLIVLSTSFLLFPKFSIKPTNFKAIIGGILSGGLAGLLGSGGPIRGLTLTSFSLRKNAFVATSAFIDFGVDFSRTIIYAGHGYVSKDILFLVPYLIVVSILGTYIGKRILKRIPQERFRVIVLGLILFVGVSILVKIWLTV